MQSAVLVTGQGNRLAERFSADHGPVRQVTDPLPMGTGQQRDCLSTAQAARLGFRQIERRDAVQRRFDGV